MEFNHDVLSGKWKQLHGALKLLRGRLKHDGSDRVTGQVEVQLGRLQERYGVAHARVQRALKRLAK